MKKKFAVITCISLILFVGCIPPRQPQKYTYTVVKPPTSAEGKKCATECEKIMLQKKQLANQEYLTEVEKDKAYQATLPKSSQGQSHRLADLSRDVQYSKIQEEYDKCVLDCGGQKETKTEMR